MFQTGVISGVSISHAHASVDEIDAASGESVSDVVTSLQVDSRVTEAFAIQTCNRAEMYVVTESDAAGQEILTPYVGGVREGAVVFMDHEESLRHLMRVASGLESLVIGEDQILGQLKTAAEDARGAGGVGPIFDQALTKAIHVGERARTETKINEGALSLGSAAVRLASREVELSGATGLVVGAGEMGTLSAKALASAGVDRIIIANRTVPHAEHVAAEVDVDAQAVAIDAAPAAAATADVIISATGSPTYVLDERRLSDAGNTVCIDIAQPRDIDPSAAQIAGVSVYDIDALESVTEETREKRDAAASAVEEMIDIELDRLLTAFKRKQADDAIRAMYESAEYVKSREIATALTKLEAHGELTEEQKAVVESLADSIIGQLLAAPTKSLRDAAANDDWTTIQTAMRLFDPGFDEPPQGTTTPNHGPHVDGEIPQHVLDQLSDD
ncbi:glutamyl-tRNA reductase [Natronocalculus amylovorans]|uniref:Glutamyl-tRNA reductase n=1 Tax=Natronocalculus amylovorans TaxID=2917812 RepID=A0AAE3FXT8_9EURY|nr:glutamyl-tRNA reductase [Natronocalculus amylovorans]MCL9816634.1 glutamyl-tRNA reductase [Natronocalculus amylovorans]NUE01077.1 glutamyl-tRNA reductase [Halorubraceae archaeon YAN]